MIPQIYNELENQTSKIKLPNKTYGLIETENQNRIIGYVDGINAIKQAAYHILNVERYSSLIYDDNYGVELTQYIGQDLGYLESTIQDTLEEALTQDERILQIIVTNIEKISIDSVNVKFTMICDIDEIEMEVNLNV